MQNNKNYSNNGSINNLDGLFSYIRENVEQVVKIIEYDDLKKSWNVMLY